MQKVEETDAGMRVLLRRTLDVRQNISEVEVLGTTFSDGDLVHRTNQSVVVNDHSSTTNVTGWRVQVVGSHRFQPAGSARCIDAEVMQGFFGLLTRVLLLSCTTHFRRSSRCFAGDPLPNPTTPLSHPTRRLQATA